MNINYQLARFVASYAKPEQVPASMRPEVSFVGRSNVGKSSIMNKIFRRKDLVKVGATPGKTRAINFFNVGDVDFVDLPGYGYAKRSKAEQGAWKPLVEGYFSQNRRFALCVLLVDIRHDASPLDLRMIEFLQLQEIPFMLVFTKADKLGANAKRKQVGALSRQLAAAGDAVVVPASSLSSEGIDDVRSLIQDAVNQSRSAIPSDDSQE
ncbi:ribosome biogenesis GTP-binding protein YihA/YsxC [Curtanaerobium respiraculi]|uniref:ribosome biogenesis GTP-binding protein YihA/YsxC n=1 Tax=Curtanaerobium respiraculi TaxID=2949669 RepID=UPI0024B34152|nr:ribosome biogenesis GTP-binding protein YihA/YsxC [Curtanaerobium respiraculi]